MAIFQLSLFNYTINGHFSIENHRFSGAILHHFYIFNRNFKNKLAFRLQSAAPGVAMRWVPTADVVTTSISVPENRIVPASASASAEVLSLGARYLENPKQMAIFQQEIIIS